MVGCEVCRRTGSEVKRCTRCQRVFYCSKECQKQDWPHHRLVCSKPVSAHSGATEASPGDTTASFDKQEQGATGGHVTAPGSSEEASASGGRSTSSQLSKCYNCGKVEPGMKKCGRCNQVTYCSRDCQRQHWAGHKSACARASANEGERSTEPEDERQEESESFVQEVMRRVANALVRHPVTPIMLLMWAGARARAARLHPGEVVVDRFNDLDSDMLFFSPFPRRMVLLCLMRGVYYHWFRHGRIVEDIEGFRMHVLFYNEQEPEPYFSYQQLREGNFLCLAHALVHGFLDGTAGLRVDDPSDVHIIELG